MKHPFSKASTSSNNSDKDKAICDDDSSNNNGDNSNKHTCYICNKGFPSKHSLFGHMRTHPNRPWTGVRPPIHSHHHKRSSSDLEKDRDDDDQRDEVVVASTINISKYSFLPKWQKTGKRGRMSTSVYDAAETLMLMSRSNNCDAIKSIMAESKLHQSSMIACKRKNTGEASTSEKKKNYGSLNIEDEVQDHVDNVDESEMKLMKLLVKNLKVLNSESETHEKLNKVISMAELKSSDHAIVDDGTMRALMMMEETIDEVKIEEDASSTQILGPKILDFDLNLTPDEDVDD